MSTQELAFSIKILGKDGELSKLAEVEKALKRTREQRAFLNKAYKEGTISENELARSTAELNTTTKALGKEKRDITRTIELETQRANTQAGTYKSLDATLQLLKRDYKALTLEERNSAKGQELLKKIQKTDSTLKKFDSSIGQNQRNVGNYSGALEGLSGVFGAFGGQISNGINTAQRLSTSLAALRSSVVGNTAATEAQTTAQVQNTTATQAQTTAQRAQNLAVSAGSKALKIFRLALISTGVGAFVVILGSLITAFATTQEGIDKVTSITRPLVSIFQRFFGVIQDVGLGILDSLKSAIESPGAAVKSLGDAIKTNLINRVKSLGVFAKALGQLFDGEYAKSAETFGNAVLQLGTGVENGTTKLLKAGDDVANFTKNAIEEGKKLDSLQKQIEETEASLALNRTKRELKYQELRTKANNQLLSDQERVKALNDAEKEQNLLAAETIKLIDLKIEKEKLEQAQNNSGRKDLKTLNDLTAERLKAETDAQKKIAGLESLNTGIQKRQLADRQKLIQQEVQANKKLVEELTKLTEENAQRAVKIRDNENAQLEEGLRKDLVLLEAATNDKVKELRSQIASEEELSKATGTIKDQLLLKNKLINDQIEQTQEAHRRDMSDIQKQYDQADLDETKEFYDLKLKEVENNADLELLALRGKVLSKEITEEEAHKRALILQKKRLEESLDLIDQETAEGKAKYQKYLNEIQDITNQQEEGGEGVSSKLAKLLDISEEEAGILIDKAVDLAQTINDAIFDIKAIQIENELKQAEDAAKERNDMELEALQERFDNGLITEAKYNLEKERLEKDLELKTERIRREAFEKRKRLAKASAIVDGVAAVISTIAGTPGGPIVKGIAAALVAAGVAAQIKTIDAEEYAQGGVISGRRVPNSARNIPTRRSGDNVAAYVKTGEVVLNDSQQKALGGDRTFAAIGVPGFAGGGRVQPFTPFAPPAINISQPSASGAGLTKSQFSELLGQVNVALDAKIQSIQVSAVEMAKVQAEITNTENESTF